MKNYFFIAGMLLCFAAGFSQNSDEVEVRKLNEAFDQAIKNADIAFYERVLAPDYLSYWPYGEVKNRSQVLEEVKKQKTNPTHRISEINSEDVNIKLSGDLAVVTAQWSSTSHSLEDDDPHKDLGRYMAVYEKRNGTWQLISEMGNEKPHTPEELEPSLKKASDQYGEAMKNRDKEAFEKLLAEDFSSTGPEGEVRSREEDIAMMFSPDLQLESISTEDMDYKIYENFAVETGQYNVTGTYKGEKFKESGRFTSTWLFKDGKWKMIADHVSVIPEKK